MNTAPPSPKKLGLRRTLLCLFAALILGNLVLLGLGLYYGYERVDDPDIIQPLIIGGTVSAFCIAGLTAWVWLVIDERLAKPLTSLSGRLRISAHGNGTPPAPLAAAPLLGDLPGASYAVMQQLYATRLELHQAVMRETARLALEKEWLETLLADVPVGVLICSGNNQLVFYNGQAIDLLNTLETDTSAGLARPVFDFLHPAPIQQAYKRLSQSNDPDAVSDLLCTTRSGLSVLGARMRLLANVSDETQSGQLSAGAAAGRPGYVLTLRPLDAETSGDPRLLTSGSLPLIRSGDLADAIKAYLEAGDRPTTLQVQDLILRCDAARLVGLVHHLAHRFTGPENALTLNLVEDGAGALLTLHWVGALLTPAQIESVLDEPIDSQHPTLTGKTIVGAHGSYVYPENPGNGVTGVRLPLREARRAPQRPPPVPRAVVYDFALLQRADEGPLTTRGLDALTYVVFDTETTGLRPDQGDEIVQIAAVRIVNGKRINTETFNTLVNPQRAIPASSTRIHGITEAMVRDAPSIQEAIRRFHKFAEGAVLVAHNAPFDMAFVRRHENQAGVMFDHLILDTVLLSAVIWGQGETHTLDALAHRLGVSISQEARHTALGDAMATADVFLKMIPALQARNLGTFQAIQAEVRQHARLLQDLNG